MSLEEFGERVWDNWKNGEGACHGCLNRDCDGSYTPKNIDPGWTSGDPDPTVVYLADCPGDGNDRSKKNSGNIEQISITLEDEADKNWQPVMQELDSELCQFFKKTGYIPETGGDAFYTNAKNCADIENASDIEEIEDADQANKFARINCEEYLEEQLELLDPQVVVGFGNRAMSSLADVYGFGRDGSITDEALQVVYDDQRPYVVPSVHWGQLWGNLRWLPGEPDRDEYWDRLAETVLESVEG
jgi:hypothetical protein